MPRSLRLPREHHAFSASCPRPDEVARLLAPLGFRLTFQMAASFSDDDPEASLPAQYHFEDAYGTQILYLAGYDSGLQGVAWRWHQARFWGIAGADGARYQAALEALATGWSLTWCPQRATKSVRTLPSTRRSA